MRRYQINLKCIPLSEIFFVYVFFIILLKAEKPKSHLYITERECLLWQWWRARLSTAKTGIQDSIFDKGESRSPRALLDNAMSVMLSSCHGWGLETELEELSWPFQHISNVGRWEARTTAVREKEALSVHCLRFPEGDVSTLPGSLQNAGLREIYLLPRITVESHLNWIPGLESQKREQCFWM